MKPENNKSSGIQDQAAEWVMKNDRGLNAVEQDAFSDWLSESTEHRDAYAEHRYAWAELGRLAGLQNTDYAPVVPDLLGKDNSPWYRKYLSKSKLAVALPIAASIALVFSIFALNPFKEADPLPETKPSPFVNQILQRHLEDGSVVDLNKGAEIETHITRDERLVKLISGEANFNVEKDTSRPFIVEVSGIRLRAVGTVFNVRMEDQRVNIVVTEGTVAVQHPKNPDPSDSQIEESLVRENYRAVVDFKLENPFVQVNPVREEDLDVELMWQPRVIDFENAPLSQIVEEFNRRNPIKIEIEDEEIGSLRFTSIFWSNNVESFVRLLEANYGISVEVVSDNRISLSKSPVGL
jgi:transmembrane sensor